MTQVFPDYKYWNDGDQPDTAWPEGGLTKRELFAAMAMQGLLSAVYSNKNMLREFTKKEYVPKTKKDEFSWHYSGCDAISRNAVSYADALIKELEAEHGEG